MAPVGVVMVDGSAPMPLMDGALGLDADLPRHRGRWLEVLDVEEGAKPGGEVIASCGARGREKRKPASEWRCMGSGRLLDPNPSED